MKKSLLILIVGLVITTNIFSQKPEFPIINRNELKNILITNNIPIPRFYIETHGRYTAVNKEWIEQTLAPSWKNYKEKNNIIYRRETVNCENYSFLFRCFPQSFLETQTLVGIIFYLDDRYLSGSNGHAINIFIIRENNKNRIVFFDPQTCKIVTLSNKELKSIFFMYF